VLRMVATAKRGVYGPACGVGCVLPLSAFIGCAILCVVTHAPPVTSPREGA
jgi:hypothetical protein